MSTANGLRETRRRNLLHAAVLTGGMALLLLLIGRLLFGSTGVLVAAIGSGVVLLLGPRLSPRLILHMYRARPLSAADAPFLNRIAGNLAVRAGLPSEPRLYYVPTRVVNAFAVGTSRSYAIGLTDGVLRALNRREISGVLAHEISHVRSNDVAVMGIADLISRVTSALSFMGQFLLLLNLPLMLLGRTTFSWVAVLLLIFAPALSSLLQLGLSRKREYDADHGAVRLTADARGLASALAKLEPYDGGVLERILLPGRRLPEPSLLRSHPHTEDRIQRLLECDPVSHAGEGPADARINLPRPPAGQVPLPAGPIPRWHLSGLWY